MDCDNNYSGIPALPSCVFDPPQRYTPTLLQMITVSSEESRTTAATRVGEQPTLPREHAASENSIYSGLALGDSHSLRIRVTIYTDDR